MLISWNVTKACNLRCLHCYRDAGIAAKDELNTAEGIRLIREIAAAGFKMIVFSGGEPLLRPDIYGLITTAADFGLRAVLGTNGTLINEQVALRLKSSGLSRIGISIDSVIPLIHDEFRQVAGSWERSVKAMSICKDLGIEFQAHTTVTGFNWREIEKISDFIAAKGARAHHIFFLVPAGRGRGIADALPGEYEQFSIMKRILNKQKTMDIELKCVCAPQFVPLAKNMGVGTRFARGCLAGISYCCVLPDGEVHACPYMPLSAGNVRRMPFERIWRESAVFNGLRSLEYKGQCGICVYKYSCGGCRARAWHASGEYMADDPSCVLNKKELADVKQ